MGKGKKKKKNAGSCLKDLKKIAGDLTPNKVDILLFGFPDDYNQTHSDSDRVAAPEKNEFIVKKKRIMAPQTKHFSNMIEERAASPMVSPRFGLSGEDETAWEPYYGKTKSFKDITKDCKEWSKRIRQTLADIKLKTSETDTKSKFKSMVKVALSEKNKSVLKRIQSSLPDATSSDSEVVVGLMELSDEMAELRHMLTLESDVLKKMNISADAIEQILFESTQLGHSADQVNLLDVENSAVGFAKNLRGIWEILYLRATGEYLPSTKIEVDEVEELQLRTVDASFVKPMSEEVVEHVEDAHTVEECVNSTLLSRSISDVITESNEVDLDCVSNVNIEASVHSTSVDEQSQPSAVLQNIINETSKNVQGPSVVPLTTFEFSVKVNENVEGLSIGFGDEKGSIVDDLNESRSRNFEKYNDILERRTTVYDGKETSSRVESVEKINPTSGSQLHFQGSFNVHPVESEEDEHIQEELTKSSITLIELRYSNSKLYCAEELNWTEQQKLNKLELLAKIKSGNYFTMNKFRKALTPEPRRTVTTPRTPLSRERRERRSRGAPVADKRPLFKGLKHVSVDFGSSGLEMSTDLTTLSFDKKVGQQSCDNELAQYDAFPPKPRPESRSGIGTTDNYSNVSHVETSQSPQRSVLPESRQSSARTVETRYLSSPEARDITAAFSPLKSYAPQSEIIDNNALSSKVVEANGSDNDSDNKIDSSSNQMQSKVAVTTTKVRTATQKNGVVTTSTVINITDIFEKGNNQRLPVSPEQKSKDRTSKIMNAEKNGQGRCSRPKSKSTVRSLQRAPRSPAKSPTTIEKSDGKYNCLPTDVEKGSRGTALRQGNEIVSALDENSASTMFSMSIKVSSEDVPPDHTKNQRIFMPVDSSAVGVNLSVSDSFVEQNKAKALQSLTHRPIRRASPRLDKRIPLAGDENVIKRNEDQLASIQDSDFPDEILNIVGNVSPRLLETDSVNSEEMSTCQSPPLVKNETLSKRKQQNIKKQMLMLSLPSASVSKQESYTVNSGQREGSQGKIKRTYSADSISDFNLSILSKSVASGGVNESIHFKIPSPKKCKEQPTITSKYLHYQRSKKTSVVSYSKLRRAFRKDFSSKHPLRVKGVECEEIYYNSQTGHVVVSTVGDRDNVSVVDIPIEDVIVTYGAFEGTLTLRCNTDAAPEDYIATIKCDDWKRIITQFENGLKRNYAKKNINQHGCLVGENQPQTDTPTLDESADAMKGVPSQSVQQSSPRALEKSAFSKAIAHDEESSISALQSIMDDMKSYPFANDSVLKELSTAHIDSQHEFGTVSGITTSHIDISGSRSIDETNCSIISKRNDKGAAPLPIIDDSTEDDHENVFLTGYYLKEKFAIRVIEQEPRDDIDKREEELALNPVLLSKPKQDHSKEVRKFRRKFPPPLSGHRLGDSDFLVENIIEKFNKIVPHQSESKNQATALAKHEGLFDDPLPRAVTCLDNKNNQDESALSLRAASVTIDENVVEYRQRTAPGRTYVAPDPTKPVPPRILDTQNRRNKSQASPSPVSYAVLDPHNVDTPTPNPRRITWKPEESTYRTLNARHPPRCQSFKSPRTGKSIVKPTAHPNVFISNEADEGSALSKMMEVSNQLLKSKASILHRHSNDENYSDDISDSPKDPPVSTCKKVELELGI